MTHPGPLHTIFIEPDESFHQLTYSVQLSEKPSLTIGDNLRHANLP